MPDLSTLARHILCRIAVKKFRYTGASVSRFLGVSTSLVNPTENKLVKKDLNEYLISTLLTNVSYDTRLTAIVPG